MTDGYLAYRPGMRLRFWTALGFRWPHVELEDDPGPGLIGEGAITTTTRIQVSLFDRLRLLISGQACVAARIYTNVPVDHAKTVSQFAVLPPGTT